MLSYVHMLKTQIYYTYLSLDDLMSGKKSVGTTAQLPTFNFSPFLIVQKLCF